MNRWRSALVGMVFVLASVPLGASTIVIPFSFGTSPVNFNQNTSVTQFDPSLGVLDSIDISLDGMISGTQQADNEDPGNADNVTLQTSVLMMLLTGGNNLLNVTPSVNNAASLAGDNDAAPDFVGTDSATFNFVDTNATSATNITNPALLTLFQGLGSTPLTLSATGSTQATGGTNLALFFATTGTGSGSLTYNYTPGSEVPEPSTFLLCGSVLTWAGLRRRFKKS